MYFLRRTLRCEYAVVERLRLRIALATLVEGDEPLAQRDGERVWPLE